MSPRPRYPKSGCCVPFCRRTSTLFKSEWLCGMHWRLVDRALKRFRTKRLRQLYRAWEEAKAQDPNSRATFKAWRQWHRSERLIWRRMKRQAIERAAGATS